MTQQQTDKSTRKRLLKTMAFSSLAFLTTGFAIQRYAAPPALTVVIDRSYCPSTQWQTLSDSYTQLYQRHQRKQVTITSVTLVSDLSQTTLKSPPTPSEIRVLKTYGKPSAQTASTGPPSNAAARFLSCQSNL